jgi:hypothetical protein
MRTATALVLALALPAALPLAGCGKTVKRTDPNAVRDLSGNWNATDVNAAAQTLTAQILAAPWYQVFNEKNQRNPRVRVGRVEVRTQDAEFVNVDILTNDLVRHMTNSLKIDVVAARGQVDELRAERTEGIQHADPSTVRPDGKEQRADYLLTGTILTQDDSEGGSKQKFYSIDIFLTDIATTKPVFVGNHKIAKDVER